jgi:hypothetical protein
MKMLFHYRQEDNSVRKLKKLITSHPDLFFGWRLFCYKVEDFCRKSKQNNKVASWRYAF